MPVPPAGTALFSITIPPHGGDTLFADQVAAYQDMPEGLRAKIDGVTAVHSAAFGYAPDGAYGESDQELGRSMQIRPSEKARETYPHPLVRTHHETGAKALYSSAGLYSDTRGSLARGVASSPHGALRPPNARQVSIPTPMGKRHAGDLG
jgi:taurine dioxygenase